MCGLVVARKRSTHTLTACYGNPNTTKLKNPKRLGKITPTTTTTTTPPLAMRCNPQSTDDSSVALRSWIHLLR